MTPREERGLIIAATCRLNRLRDGTWLVPSQSTQADGAAYRVNLEAKTCTCKDHTEGGHTCKHYYAASIVHMGRGRERDSVFCGSFLPEVAKAC